VEILAAPRLLLGQELVAPGWVAVDGPRIVAAGAGRPPAAPRVVLPAGTLAPGFVDAQLNGGFGVDLATADATGWRRLAATLPRTGVTAFVPTVLSAPIPAQVRLLHRYRALRSQLDAAGGARSLGVHLEGPFLAPARRGAHRREHLRDPDPTAVQTLLDAGGSDLAYVTLAPELPGAAEAIERFVTAGVRVAVGHSDASDADVRAAADRGATLVTHLYNAQPPLTARAPGVVGAALADPRLTAGLIADGYHVARSAIVLAFAAAPGRIMLVTDATAALGLPPGRYQLAGQVTDVPADGPPRLPDGTLAGAAVGLDAAVGVAVRAGVAPATALLAATRVPADALGVVERGRVAVGAPADLVWLDEQWRARATWIGGRQVHGDTELPPAA
jgi:N-acetylglucosamine-6-phosphate deacetylase